MSLVLSKFLVTVSFIDSDSIAKRLVYQTRVGKQILVAEVEWRLIESKRLDQIPSLFKDLLLEAEVLIDSERNELAEVLDENDVASESSKQLYQVIMPTAGCQLACNNSAFGNYCGQDHSNQMLSDHDQELLLLRVKDKLKLHRFKSLKIAWFGGEALLGLGVIRSLSSKFVKLSEELDCSYSAKIVTNGLRLTQDLAKELYMQHQVKQVEITLDGAAAYHDSRRVTKQFHGSTFYQIFSNLLSVASSQDLEGLDLSVRCNVDRRNKDGVKPLLEELVENDLHKRVRFYIAPVHPWGNDVTDLSMSSSEFAEFEMEVFTQMVQLGFKVKLLPSRKKVNCLTVQKHSEVIDPFGVIHNCSETPLVSAYEMDKSLELGKRSFHSARSNQYALGTLTEDTAEDSLGYSLSNFNDSVRLSNVPCADCAMLPVCGGSCPLQWHQGNIPCPPAKLNIQSRLLLQYAMAKTDQSSTLDIESTRIQH